MGTTDSVIGRDRDATSPGQHRPGSRGNMVVLDFMTAIVLFTIGIGAILGIYGTIADGGGSDRAADLASARIGDRLADDLLVARPGEGLDVECTTAFFDAETATTTARSCGFDRFDGSSTAAYLHSALALDDRFAVRVTLGGPSATVHEIGPDPPAGEVTRTYRRVVGVDGTLGGREITILRVTVWDGGR